MARGGGGAASKGKKAVVMKHEDDGSTPNATPPSSSVAAGGPNRKRNEMLAKYGALVYFFLIILQIPLFRSQCRAGMCTTPLLVTSSQLVASEIFPAAVVKTLLYPGAVVQSLATTRTLPNWSNLFDMYNLTEAKNVSAKIDVERLEVLAGSYFCVTGALVGVIVPGRMTLFGTLLVIWGVFKEAVIGKPPNTDPTKAAYVYPTMVIAFVSASLAMLSMKSLRRHRAKQPISLATPLGSSAKSKLN